MKKTVWVIVAILALLGLGIVLSYNNLVALNENVNNKWSQIDIQLQRRAELIPNLVATVKGYAAQEKDILKSIADARSKLVGAQSVAEKAQADAELSSAFSRLLVIVENYPNLKSDANFRQLADELAGTENRIAVARKDYNDAAQAYNAKIKRFPTVIIANMFGFQPREYFTASGGVQTPPKVDFGS